MLLLSLLEADTLAKFLTILLQLDLALDFLLVLACPIDLAGGLVLYLDEFIL